MGGLIDRDLGYRAMLSALAGLREADTRIGIHEEEGASDTGGDLNLAGIAMVNEFGSDDGHIPERSFLRATVDANAVRYEGMLERAVTRAIDGDAPLQTGLALLGARVEGDVKATITDMTEPPNAPSTIAAKGSSKVLVDTGAMRAAIRHEEQVS